MDKICTGFGMDWSGIAVIIMLAVVFVITMLVYEKHLADLNARIAELEDGQGPTPTEPQDTEPGGRNLRVLPGGSAA